ncbi:MAG: sigma 54-interacting transcriptional regulator [Desulfobacteraceae bacterium]|nr:sigma 54-interacting transcriptional regulator [Desulfobacteraceae bacterium]MCB9494645.1 sigma 54-interacting transcriptional regulator [Desulfobacteraceae bacterium]
MHEKILFGFIIRKVFMDLSGVRALVVDDEESIRFVYRTFLESKGAVVTLADDFDEAVKYLNDKSFDIIFTDIYLNQNKGTDILDYTKKQGIDSPVIIITGQPDIDSAAEAVRLGAFDYLTKPVKKEKFLSVSKFAFDFKQLNEMNKKNEAERDNYRKNLDIIFKTVKEGILTVDRNFKIIEANSALKKICSTAENIRGNDFREFSGNCRKKCIELLKNALEKNEECEEIKIECFKNNLPGQTVLASASPLPDNTGALLVLRDVSNIVKMESEIKKHSFSKYMVGSSEKMLKVFELISLLSETDTTVLITGESGTGKELAAKFLHSNGIRSSNNLVAINCSAFSENLLESELFGHVKGAFTGAYKDKPGRFLNAHNGTLFLDEIGDISPQIQIKLLRFLQEMEFEPVGSDKTLKVDVRVIAATNKNLKEKVENNEFREDLYYRLNVVNIELPPLRERKDDIIPLFEHFKTEFNSKMGKRIKFISNEAVEILYNYNWPGNIREFKHSIEHAFVLCQGDIITPEYLPRDIITNSIKDTNNDLNEKRLILETLKKTNWNKAKASRILGISRQTLYRKMKKFILE